jgi:DNA mismatch repair ATPase MutL
MQIQQSQMQRVNMSSEQLYQYQQQQQMARQSLIQQQNYQNRQSPQQQQQKQQYSNQNQNYNQNSKFNEDSTVQFPQYRSSQAPTPPPQNQNPQDEDDYDYDDYDEEDEDDYFELDPTLLQNTRYNAIVDIDSLAADLGMDVYAALPRVSHGRAVNFEGSVQMLSRCYVVYEGEDGFDPAASAEEEGSDEEALGAKILETVSSAPLKAEAIVEPRAPPTIGQR